MLGKRASVACALALCVLSSDFRPRPASAGETHSASVFVVPVPVPAVRPRKAALPAPPPPQINPIENLAGKWSGQATMVPASGRNEQFRCIITYEIAGAASRVRQHLRCQGDERSFDAVKRMDIVDERVTGVWADNVYSIGGTLHGKVNSKGFTVQLRSTFFDAKLSVISSDCQQTVKLVPDDPSIMKELAATLKKC